MRKRKAKATFVTNSRDEFEFMNEISRVNLEIIDFARLVVAFVILSNFFLFLKHVNTISTTYSSIFTFHASFVNMITSLWRTKKKRDCYLPSKI